MGTQKAASDAATPRRDPDHAFLELRDLIVTGKLSPGAPIIEMALAEKLGFTRTVIRAAMRRLELEGYVNSVKLKKYSRMVVAPLTAESVGELFAIMGALEGLATREAASREEDARQQIADEMEALNQALLQASTGNPADVVDAQELHVRFHTVPANVAAGPILFAQIETIKHRVERYERLYTHVLISGISDSVKEHQDIIAAVRAGDPDAAQRATEMNWRRGAERYERALARVGPRGRL